MLLLAVLTPPTAASSCMRPHQERTDVLQNTVAANTPLLVTSTWGHRAQLLAESVRVRGPDGALVPFQADGIGHFLRLTPVGL